MSEKGQASAAKKALIIMLIVDLFVVLVIFLMTVLFSNSESTPSFLGHTYYISDMAKMDDAVPVNSLVVAKNGRPDGSVIGGVILCENVDGFDSGIFRVVGVESTTDTFIYKVCLDAAPNTVFEIDAQNVIGECKYSYHTLGRMILFITSKLGIIVCVAIPALILAIIELILGFMKEMRKRDLQKKRERVKKEQAKQFSTKRPRSKSFSVDDFKNEEANLKKQHQHRKRGDAEREDGKTRRPSSLGDERTRRIDIREDRTRIISLEEEKREIARRKADEADKAQMPFAEPDRDAEKAADNIHDDMQMSVKAADESVQTDKEPVAVAVGAVSATEQRAAGKTAESVVTDKPRHSTSGKQMLNPSMSLDEMMALMNSSREKFRKDIEDNK